MGALRSFSDDWVGLDSMVPPDEMYLKCREVQHTELCDTPHASFFRPQHTSQTVDG